MIVGFLLVLVAALTVGGKPLTDDGRLAHLKRSPDSRDVIVATAVDRNDGFELGPP